MENKQDLVEGIITETEPVVSKLSVDKQKLYLPVSIVIAAVLISGSIVYTRSSGTSTGDTQGNIAEQTKKVDVSMDDDAYLGNPSAPVKIIEFSDFQCPYCRTFWSESLPSIKKDYVDTGKAVFVYRDFPLSFHPAALISALAANCAKDQGKYWEMHDKMFLEELGKGTGTITYGSVDLKKWAKEIGLDANTFNQCLDSQKYKAEVDKDIADGSSAGVSGTPTTFVNGVAIVGAQPYATFKAAIDKALAEAATQKKGFFK